MIIRFRIKSRSRLGRCDDDGDNDGDNDDDAVFRFCYPIEALFYLMPVDWFWRLVVNIPGYISARAYTISFRSMRLGAHSTQMLQSLPRPIMSNVGGPLTDSG